MHRNTKSIVIVLSVIAALLMGINIGRKLPKFGGDKSTPKPLATEIELSETSPPEIVATPTPEPTMPPSSVSETLGAEIAVYPYANSTCGYTLTIPQSWQYLESGALITTFTNVENADETINIICSEEIERPQIESKLIESTTLGGVNAELYHDQIDSGDFLDAVIATVPNQNYSILVAGYGSVFNHILATFEFTQGTQPAEFPPQQPQTFPSME